MANYPVEQDTLLPFLPPRTELDTWGGDPYVSLVGFQFREVRVKGRRIPFHTHFPEVNLRFYVRYKDGSSWKRGVVFVREIVPLPAVAWVANILFRERYISLPMRYVEASDETVLRTAYHWYHKNHWNSISLKAASQPQHLREGSQEEFITEHFWGYAKAGADNTNEYQVAHPRWEVYPVTECLVECDFGRLYGPAFAGLGGRKPQSAFLAEGSAISVYSKSSV